MGIAHPVSVVALSTTTAAAAINDDDDDANNSSSPALRYNSSLRCDVGTNCCRRSAAL